jgi:hypothetical protein
MYHIDFHLPDNHPSCFIYHRLVQASKLYQRGPISVSGATEFENRRLDPACKVERLRLHFAASGKYHLS